MKSHISRRSIMISAGLLGMGSTGVISLIDTAHGDADKNNPNHIISETDSEKFKPRYVPISPQEAADLAYKCYPEGACMYTTVKSIVTLVAKKDSSAVPPIYYDMFKYGHGGCGTWGTLCGMCNGGAAVMGLFHQDQHVRDPMIGELFRWYESAELPQYTPVGAEPLPAFAAGSVLCHISMSNWCREAKEDAFGDKRKERCRRMTADAVKKIVEILNAQYQREQDSMFNGASPKNTQPLTPPDSCIQCHSVPGGKTDAEKDAPKAIVRMNCASCHDHDKKHPNGHGK